MNRIRHHRLRTPLSLMAMLALLWSQLVLANHPACSWAGMAASDHHAAHAAQSHAHDAPPPCHAPPVAPDTAVCASHCSQGDLSSDASRLVSVPALGPLPMFAVITVRHLPNEVMAEGTLRPRGSWHRPTVHPASLLLI